MNGMTLLPTLLLALSLGCTVEGTKAPGDTGATEANDTGEDTHDDTGDDTELDFDTAPDTDPDTHTYDSGEVDPTELPNLSEGLATDACEEVPGYEDLAGATSYFVGTYARIEDGTWIGFETWLLYATSEWEASGGADCQVVWDVAGSETSPDACPGCELALSLSATVNAGSTTCPAALYSDDRTWSVSYDVDLQADEQVAVYFSSSGNLVGAGYGGSNAFTFVTDASCTWF